MNPENSSGYNRRGGNQKEEISMRTVTKFLKNNWGSLFLLWGMPLLAILACWLKFSPPCSICPYIGQVIFLGLFAFIFCGGLRFVVRKDISS